MGYFLRILSPDVRTISADVISTAVRTAGGTVMSAGPPSDDGWTEIGIHSSDQKPLCILERNEVGPGSIAAEEIEEFLDELEQAQPESAVIWLSEYLKTIRTVYAFQVLDAAWHGRNWDILAAAYDAVFKSVKGISQADGEGFSNEEGFHILWQFSSDVKGERLMAIHKAGQWIKFKMDLGNRIQRASFLLGEIPKGVSIIS